MTPVEVWPLHGVRLRTADLDLRVMTEADLPNLTELMPPDLDLDPHATRYDALDEAANRRAVMAQSYWRAMGLWSPDDWAVPFVVRRDGDAVGVQWLEGPDYRADRTVDSASWLVREARGHGYGKQMRAAVLELAFRCLGAEAAISSAVVTNDGSLGVSRALGYRDTHRSTLRHSGQELQHVRLTRSHWVASRRGETVRVEGIEAALPLFGLGHGPDAARRPPGAAESPDVVGDVPDDAPADARADLPDGASEAVGEAE